MGEAHVFSKLDLNKGFYQIPVQECDWIKTAFISPWGKFEFLCMPFGLRNAPSTFQHATDQVLTGLNEFCNVYIDDIIVYSTEYTQHISHLRQVLDRLK